MDHSDATAKSSTDKSNIVELVPRQNHGQAQTEDVRFDRRELDQILRVYSFMVAGGDWRDYGISHMKDRAVFSIFRRTSEMPLYRIEKNPRNARRQGAWSVITPTGQIIKRGQDLGQVLKVFDKQLKLVQAD